MSKLAAKFVEKQKNMYYIHDHTCMYVTLSILIVYCMFSCMCVYIYIYILDH